jgi:hypothetical protein
MASKKTDETAEAQAESVQTEDTATAEKAETNLSGFYIYIGPSIKGLIHSGKIFRGDRASALAAAGKAIQAQPEVKTLIVSGDYLPQARQKVKEPGNILYASYRKLAGK